jgi:hypothetical protein
MSQKWLEERRNKERESANSARNEKAAEWHAFE